MYASSPHLAFRGLGVQWKRGLMSYERKVSEQELGTDRMTREPL